MPNPRPETLYAEQQTLKRLKPQEFPWTGDVSRRLVQEVFAVTRQRFPQTPERQLWGYVHKGVSRALVRARQPNSPWAPQHEG